MQARQQPYVSRGEEFRAGAASPSALLEACIEAIDAHEDEVGAFAHLALSSAREAAEESTQRWRRGQPRSVIDGMPVGVKDVIDTADQPTQYGSRFFAGHQPKADAASVHALREAGAVIVGKTVTTEFSGGEPGRTRNPIDLSRTPGGSSSGSAAAVATGMVPAALGTQALASIIRPASYCGTYGYKPSVGGINRGGVLDVNSQSVLGTLAATLDDAWALAGEIAARAGGDPGYPGVDSSRAITPTPPRRIGFLRTPDWSAAPAECQAAVEELLAELSDSGIALIEDDGVAQLEDALATAADSYLALTGYERRWPLQAYAAADLASLGKRTASRIGGPTMAPQDYRAALAERAEIRTRFSELRGSVDVFLTLSSPGPAPAIEGGTGPVAFGAHATYLGAPAVSLPGLSSNGLPVGIQVVGFRDHDDELIDHAAWLDPRVNTL
ncbi:MAG TPA: amidase [Actinomycetaceae bacterium]|nr:amidase [Actinomycetaceae bacterium]